MCFFAYIYTPKIIRHSCHLNTPVPWILSVPNCFAVDNDSETFILGGSSHLVSDGITRLRFQSLNWSCSPSKWPNLMACKWRLGPNYLQVLRAHPPSTTSAFFWEERILPLGRWRTALVTTSLQYARAMRKACGWFFGVSSEHEKPWDVLIE